MATLGANGKVTLLDLALATDPNGSIATCAELLMRSDEILLDIPWKEGNLQTGHQATIRTGLPTSVWRSFYQGVPPSKSRRAKVTDACGMLEARAEIDKDEADLNGNANAFRMSEAAAFTESLNQAFADNLFYGNASTNPERFNGLAPRFSSLSAGSGENIINCGGSGNDNTSVWLIGWGENSVHGIYPKGHKSGLDHEDLGVIDATDENGSKFRAYADVWKWKCGLHVRDWRYISRAANIDTSDLTGNTGTQAVTATSTAATSVINAMVKQHNRVKRGAARYAYYANKQVREMLVVQALNRSQSCLSIVDAVHQFGNISIEIPELRFLGIPVRTCEAILSTEAAVV